MNIPNSSPLTDKVETNFDILCALVSNRVDKEVDDVNVDVVDEGTPRKRVVKLLEKLLKLGRLSHVIGTTRHSASALELEIMGGCFDDQETCPKDFAAHMLNELKCFKRVSSSMQKGS